MGSLSLYSFRCIRVKAISQEAQTTLGWDNVGSERFRAMASGFLAVSGSSGKGLLININITDIG